MKSQMSHILLLFMCCVNTQAFYSKIPSSSSSSKLHSSTKENLLNIFTSKEDDIFACPDSLTSMTKQTRVYGFYTEQYWEAKEFNRKYRILQDYNDLTIPTEVEKPIWALSNRERIGQNFFQTPVIPFLYERGKLT